MKFGTGIMGASIRNMPEVARIYEDNGFESIWMPEHLVIPDRTFDDYPYASMGESAISPNSPTYDPWVILSHLSNATTKIRLATNVYILPLRHPLQTARSVITLDRVSGGRVTLGIGVGWMKDEFDYVGLSFSDRGRRTDSIIGVLRRLWSEDLIEVHDEHFDFGPVGFMPKPINAVGIPIEVGGVSTRALERAGSLGDGWIETDSPDVNEVQRRLEIVQAARRASGRDGNFEVTVCSDLPVSTYIQLAEIGVTRIVVDPRLQLGFRLAPEAVSDWAKKFADEVISKFS